MKILFLDFDGVLNTREFLTELHTRKVNHTENLRRDSQKGNVSGDSRWVDMVDPSKVALLNQIIEETNCLVVVSSSWRIQNTRQDLQSILDKRGFKGHILGKTGKRLSNHWRGNEIRWWLQDWRNSGRENISSFVILDDESDMLDLMPRLVQTSFNDEGLTQSHVDKAIQMLNEDMDWSSFNLS